MPRDRARKRKRKFQGNKKLCESASAKKQKTDLLCASANKINIPETSCGNDNDNYNVILNFGILKQLLELFLQCPRCKKNDVCLLNDLSKRQGFSYRLVINCNDCLFEKSLYSSEVSSVKALTGRAPFKINLQTVLSFREIGKGYQSIELFSALMNMPPAFSKPTYTNLNDILHTTYKKVADKSTASAAECLRKKAGDVNEIQNCQVSVDGTWQKRGHASINGVVTVISTDSLNGKCLDAHVMSKNCFGCKMWHKKKNSQGYNDWKANHVCQANHIGSSGSMEAAGAKEIFHRSVDRNLLRYTEYIGDGDTSSFSVVSESKPYADYNITKLECVGHVQKRLGTRCRNLCQKLKGKILSDGKRINGKGRLTEKAINTLQNYYGMAIRQNVNNLYKMKKCVYAVLYHNSNIADLITRHQFCPRDVNSWCLWQSDQITGKSTYKPKLSLPLALKTELTGIFRDLSSEELLSKCTHGKTQNNNESLNGVIWKKCPKSVYVSKKILELGVYSAIIEFNDGSCGLKPVFDLLGFNNLCFLQNRLAKRDTSRINAMKRKSSEAGISQRKHLRAVRKGFIDTEKENEPKPSYSTGDY